MSTTPEYRAAWKKDQHFGRVRTVDALGTRRRLQALARVGWSFAELARRCELSRNGFLHIVGERNPRVRRFVAERVNELFAELWDVAPPSTPASIRRTIEAARQGWAPPAAWDNIDDPNETPADGYRPAKQRPADETRDEVEHFRFMGDTDETIAARLGMTLDGLYRALGRAERRAA